MILKGEVIEVADSGGCLTVSIQAKVGRAEWKPIERSTFRVDDTAANRKAFYVGRRVAVTVRPR